MNKDVYKSMGILVVEDEIFFQQLLVRLLSTLGATNVAVAENGAQALSVLSLTAAESFGLVITDIVMPGMDGFELARKIRLGTVPKYKDIPILMLTGHSTEENVRKGRIHRIQGFIVKPPTVEILERHMARALKKK